MGWCVQYIQCVFPVQGGTRTYIVVICCVLVVRIWWWDHFGPSGICYPKCVYFFGIFLGVYDCDCFPFVGLNNFQKYFCKQQYELDNFNVLTLTSYNYLYTSKF